MRRTVGHNRSTSEEVIALSRHVTVASVSTEPSYSADKEMDKLLDEAAEELPTPITQRMMTEARKLGMYIIWPQYTREGGQAWISSRLLTSSGWSDGRTASSGPTPCALLLWQRELGHPLPTQSRAMIDKRAHF